MRRFPRTAITATLALTGGLLVSVPAQASPWDSIRVWETAKVERVVDGDTLIVRDAVTDARSRIRLLGINSPEKPTKLHPGWCGGWQAMDALTELIPPGTTVRLLSADQSSKGKGRPQRVVLAENKATGEFDLDVAWAMAERGWGHWFTQRKEANMSSLYRAVIEGAQQRRVGMWNPNMCGELEQPEAQIEMRIARSSSPRLLNDEWVEIQNVGATPVDLSGWTLRDAGNQAWYTLPPGSVLTPGDYRVIHTGSGTPGLPNGQDVYRGYNKLLYPSPGKEPNLIGDGAYLLDRFGNYRFWREYPCTERCAADPATGSIVIQDFSLGKGKGQRRSATQYVRLANQGPVRACLDAYQLRSDAMTYNFPPGTCLEPGETWTLHGGKDGATGTTVYLGRRAPMFYLSGSLQLVSDRDQVVVERTW